MRKVVCERGEQMECKTKLELCLFIVLTRKTDIASAGRVLPLSWLGGLGI